MYKQKIINDPVHGFITVPTNLVAQLIEHPYVQRLRNIKQLGMSNLVYPGACHTRFQHAIGAMYLMMQALDVLCSKGCNISDEEVEATTCAILLHDIGHGPFSHSLENSIIGDGCHEYVSIALMREINNELGGALDLAISIFQNKYHKKFLHQLVSSQLDVDRLDYLARDSFFSGVAEGMIGLERIIKMLNVADDELVVDAKGIYSIEKFLISRHLMYWQVYLHKTVLSAEYTLVKILQRAKELSQSGSVLFAPPALNFFLKENICIDNLLQKFNDTSALEQFTKLADCDIESSIKVWSSHSDKVLSTLCRMLNNRRLLRCEIADTPFDEDKIEAKKTQTKNILNIDESEINYFVIHQKVSNKAYSPKSENIKILHRDGSLVDISKASAILKSSVFSTPTNKYMLCYAKEK